MNGNKTILITGGTGSFGQGFVKKVLDDPTIRMIRVYSRDEHKQRAMRHWTSNKLSFFIGDIRDKERLKRAMDGVDWVIHAAALKQAPLGEIEPQEFIKTNIIGTMNLIEACLDCNVEKALFISTDKAVEPVNLYGATKMCAEKMFLQADLMHSPKRTRFACTRYGNVAGTAGSVVPFFLSLKEDEPTPVHDPKATRFWITLEAANQFVYDSIRNMSGGEVFIPKLKSARILDIAEAVRPGKQVVVVGERDGDKRHETLDINGSRYSSDQNDFMTVEEIRDSVWSNNS